MSVYMPIFDKICIINSMYFGLLQDSQLDEIHVPLFDGTQCLLVLYVSTISAISAVERVQSISIRQSSSVPIP